MSRLSSLALLSALSFATVAHAQSQAEIAEKLNEEGKELMYANKYPEATAKFRQAVARVNEPKYFFNLCVSLTNEGNLVEARANCYTAKNNGNGEVVGKADKMMAKIEDLAKQQGTELPPLGGGQGPVSPSIDSGSRPSDPNADPSHQPPPTRVGMTDPQHPQTAPPIRYQAPEENLVRASTPDNKYVWTLGFDLLGGGGQIGQKDAYGSAAVGFRLKTDYLFDPIRRIGGEGYLQYQHLDQGKNDSLLADTLDIIDVGVAAYKHFCLGGRLCVTPLIGVHLALMSPAGESDDTGSQLFNYAAVGGRAEVALSYAFGRRFEHVLSLTGGANFYSQVLSDSSDYSAAEVGLDKGGALGYIALGYTRRFNTPLGSSPFITLE